MDEAVRTRQAAHDAVTDIEPDALRELLEDRLHEGSMAPGALTLSSARAIDGSATAGSVAERGAGVQLIYEGLRLTRTLAHEQPWAQRDPNDHTEPNLEILAADVLVSRGFYLLARTEAADKAVETVQAFGRDQTLRRSAESTEAAASLDRSLERNVFELAVIAGATAGDSPWPTADAGLVPPQLLDLATELGGADAPLPPADELLPNDLDTTLGSRSSDGADDHVQQSATDH
ncbi:hypothetical protein ACFQL3_16745 [Natronoarchaeum sp. GCM10025321]|uniref:DUF7114 family protein n=1 Tax=Natronoarchaeum sp. GCM10025321 TaxID=3252684 RepID=UPI0036061544